ncbi:MAG: flavin-dependent oxidoreductase [Phenylobacterium sp.]|jgi:2-polyprenyl-6-methoxyphenol hydroxylase-like FAD-dependent oxidoreductase|uniref:flavin-dependent oxidoreductase n=1 Tax=Phenylobacterium sp. TaxID=1871053 RepID=UPI002A36434F|nr:flavin-dependent oxidoreductase [Phenylobacterium sp.]MDX9999623.1 flavin-dependent oxidoreductase [Phenylobacterium sp.]
MRVIIVGAGISGLSLALSLHAAGIEAEVYEAVPEIRPLGVGINLLPHAMRELTELGLADVVASRGIATGALMYANRFGQEIWREPRGRAAGYHWPQISIRRGVLQMLLLEAVKTRLGEARIHLDHEAVSADPEAGVVRFRSRVTGEARPEARGDVVVAADGIHSALRAQLHPGEGPPVWNRRVLWRGVTLGRPYLNGRTMVMAGHQDQKFVCYPIDPAAEAEGKALVNWIAELRFRDETDWRREDWNRPGRLEDFLPRFEAWRFAWLDVPELIRGAEAIYEYPMVDRDPLERWTFGRLTLMGDAAHPMYPIGSNGASQGILDARTLAFELATRRDADAALAAYEAARRPATSRLVLANRGNGPEQVMQLAHERAPQGFAHVHDVLSPAELEEVAAGYKRLAGFDRDALNARPSLTVPA